MEKFIYIVISRTPTKFGGLVRKCAKQQYNHASIALDEDLSHIYAFARSKHNSPLISGLVRESLDRFTLRKNARVPVIIFKIPVTQEQYDAIYLKIEEMLYNKKYVYNLFSVLSHPFTKGFTVKHAFSCIEFVAYILQYLGFLLDKPACKYKPDDLISELEQYIYKKDDIRKCTNYNPIYNPYFDSFQWRTIPKSIASVGRVFKHSFCRKPLAMNRLLFNICVE
jgi:hypothetical protein